MTKDKASASKSPAKSSGRRTRSPQEKLLPPRADVVFSENERKRRALFESAKKHHRPGEAELCYRGSLPPWSPGWLLIQGARQNNLKSIDVPIPLSAFTAVTGVSGSGKSSLVEEILARELARVLNRAHTAPGAFDRIVGADQLNKVIEVDQQPLGQTPTSNPATYTGLFDLIRSLYAKLPESRLRGWTARRFSFNVPGGRCERCEGAGQLKIEMHFLADVWIACDACGGKRYDPQTLEVTYRGKSIADVLEMSCGEALLFFDSVPAIRRILRILCDVGLDYLALGQSATMLSGGEAQRIKLAAELARPDTGKTLYILDEPTTGLHFEDLRKLLGVLQRLVDLGNTVVVIEHNLDVIKSADWVIDLGPEAGLEGGELVFAGTPEELADYGRRYAAAPPKKRKGLLRSWTAEALIPVLERDPYRERPLYDPAEETRLLLLQKEDSEKEAESLQSVPMPWETDGRSWHVKSRRSRNGYPCKWSGQVLAEVVDRIEDSGLFAETNWNSRSVVEIAAPRPQLGWFFHAHTGDEWLLKLKFRLPRQSCDREKIEKELWLRPLNEVPEVPLYGTQPRVVVESVGPWLEVELRVFDYDEFNLPVFWNFIDEAAASFRAYADSFSGGSDPKPKSKSGESWHFSKEGFSKSAGPLWSFDLLREAVETIRGAAPGAREEWNRKATVSFYRPDSPDRLLCVFYTKFRDAVPLQINMPKSSAPIYTRRALNADVEIDDSGKEFDLYYVRLTGEKDLAAGAVRKLIEEALRREVPAAD